MNYDRKEKKLKSKDYSLLNSSKLMNNLLNILILISSPKAWIETKKSKFLINLFALKLNQKTYF
jgi:hypothetical protein